VAAQFFGEPGVLVEPALSEAEGATERSSAVADAITILD